MDDIDFFQRLGFGLVLFGIYETTKGHYVTGPLMALTGAGLVFVEYNIDVAREHNRRNRLEIDYLSQYSEN